MYDETTRAASWIPGKLHVSSIDWAAFKQIRNDDLLGHFESYGPIRYVEWLGDVSCNVCFADKHSASRALMCLSNELPSPPPPAPNPTAATAAAGTPGEPLAARAIDLGRMTWRLGKRPIRKISNDRHGRKGTTARYLLRVATTDDVLIERPNSWPEPPGGFCSDRVLGPGSDFADAKGTAKARARTGTNGNQNHKQKPQPKQQQQQQQNKSKRKRGRGENENNNNSNNGNSNKNKKKNSKNDRKKTNKARRNANEGSDPGLLNRGLSSGRAGFSVEEMEKERQAKKRQKTC